MNVGTDRHDDARLAREVETLFDVDPPPEFLARVRQRVANEPVASGRVSWAWAGAVGAAVILLAVVLIPGRSLEAPPASAPRVLPSMMRVPDLTDASVPAEHPEGASTGVELAVAVPALGPLMRPAVPAALVRQADPAPPPPPFSGLAAPSAASLRLARVVLSEDEGVAFERLVARVRDTGVEGLPQAVGAMPASLDMAISISPLSAASIQLAALAP